jgi:hypothetical protein
MTLPVDPEGLEELLNGDLVTEQKAALDKQSRRQKTLIILLSVFTVINLAVFGLQILLGAAFGDVQNVVNRQEISATYQRQVSQAARCVSGAQSAAQLALLKDLDVINTILVDPTERDALADPDSQQSKDVAIAAAVIAQAVPTLQSIYDDSLLPEAQRTGGSCPIPAVPKALQDH